MKPIGRATNVAMKPCAITAKREQVPHRYAIGIELPVPHWVSVGLNVWNFYVMVFAWGIGIAEDQGRQKRYRRFSLGLGKPL